MRCIKCLLNFSGKKTYLLCSVLLSCLLCLSGVLSTSVSAYNFAYDGQVHYLSVGNNTYLKQDSLSYPISGSAIGDNVRFNGLLYGFSVRELSIEMQYAILNEPTLASFDVSFFSQSPTNTFYYGLEFREAVKLSDSCANINLNAFYSVPSEAYETFTCHILLLINEPGLKVLHSMPQSEWLFFQSQQGTLQGSGSVTVTPIVTRGISNNGLSSDDRAWLQQNLSNGGANQQQVEQAVNDALDQQQQDAQDQFQDTQDDADADSDSSSQQATASGTTLLAGFQSFLGALTGASPSNCVINADMGNMDLGSIDLCDLDPPPAFQAISSIMVIGFTVPLSLALGKKMIALFRSFQT